MPFSRDQVSTSTPLSGSNTTTVSFNTLPSTSAFIVAACWNTTNEIPTIADSSGNSYVRITGMRTSLVTCHIYYTNYKLTLPGSPPLTITFTAPNNDKPFWGAQAASYTHSLAGTFLPDINAISTAAGQAEQFQYISGAPQGSGDLMVSAMGQNSSGTSEGVTLKSVSGQTGNFAIVGTAVNDGSQFEVGGMGDFITTDSTAKSVFWSWTANDIIAYASVLVPFYLQPFANDVTTQTNQAVKRAAFF